MINYFIFSFTWLSIIINNLIGDIYASTCVWNNPMVMISTFFFCGTLRNGGPVKGASFWFWVD